MKAYCIVTAAGCGKRMGADKNKILLTVGGKSVLCRTFKAVADSKCFDGVVVAAKRDEFDYVNKAAFEAGINVLAVEGGSERQYSVANALAKVPDDADIIAVMDAARCFTTPELIRECVKSAADFGSGVAGKMSKDTVKYVENGTITSTIDRSHIALIETPQVFKADIIKKAYKQAENDGFLGTDDCSLVERMGISPVLVNTDIYNVKLTTPEDLKMANALVGGVRIGYGTDTHAVKQGRKLVIGGVDIPCDFGLDGHSDADVLVHAIMDALLGAAAMRDIGYMFPDTDMSYKDICSLILLKEVVRKLNDAGYEVVNIDSTIVAQAPKLSPYIDEMIKNIAECLNIPKNMVNVKATTTEHLGFEGRGEGISAHAVCIIKG